MATTLTQWKNKVYTADSLYVMSGMDSGSVDLIYLDPPFNSKRVYNAPLKSKAAGAQFKDTWTWRDVDEAYLEHLIELHPSLVQYIQSVGNIHGKPMMSYLTYMTQRALEMYRILKLTGSLYLHCDTNASHYLKIVLDKIFGKTNLRNEIIWYYKTGGVSTKYFSRKHDTIFFYSKSGDYSFTPLQEKSYLSHNYGFKNIEILQDELGSYRMVNCRDVWDISALRGNQPESTGYPTQKPLELLKRIIKASSNESDLVLDPFCGCATTCVAAQRLNRRWIGIDIDAKAAELTAERLGDEGQLFTDFVNTTQLPKRSDLPTALRDISTKARLYREQREQCNGCGVQFEMRNLEIDHKIPSSKGGGDFYENYQLLCGSCNRIKRDRTMDYLNAKLEKILKAKNLYYFG